MRYAIVSDIHSNLPAWNAVLADLSALKARKIICLGDVVGYGPQPEAVLESVYRHIDYFVMGNHDAVVAGK
ncbi:MAG: metallophosphoesterase, partial [Kiritimatiellae bacterium]|nr:metallophosphoesterase [Kiritimatiellia bacterium]